MTRASGTAQTGWSLTGRLTWLVLGLVAAGWLAAAAIALWRLDHETNETLDLSLDQQARSYRDLLQTGGPGIATDILAVDRTGSSRQLRMVVGGKASPAPWPVLSKDGHWEGRGVNGEGWHVVRRTVRGGAPSVELGETTAVRRAELGESVQGLVLAMLPLVLLLLAVIRKTMERGLRPVMAMSDRVGARKAGDLSPVPVEGLPREMLPVAAAFNAYLTRIAALIEAERNFTANAAHELRTPIATALAQVQVLRHEVEGLEPVEATIKGLAGVVERVLQLARADSGLGFTRHPTDILRVARLVCGDYPEVVFDDGDLTSLIVPADPDAISMILRNLLENAIHHGGGAVRVRVAAAPPTVTVENAVLPGASFYEGRFARDAASQGVGLGLSIVRALTHQLSIKLTFAMRSKAAEVRLEWPSGEDPQRPGREVADGSP